jgi:hypothetical protein
MKFADARVAVMLAASAAVACDTTSARGESDASQVTHDAGMCDSDTEPECPSCCNDDAFAQCVSGEWVCPLPANACECPAPAPACDGGTAACACGPSGAGGMAWRCFANADGDDASARADTGVDAATDASTDVTTDAPSD